MKLLLYCPKAKPYLYKTEDTTYPAYPIGYHTDKDLKLKLSNTNELANLNGKIVAECDFEVEEITIGRSYGFNPNMCIISTKNLQPIELLTKSCYENYDDLFQYLKYDFDNDYGTHKEPYGYAIHIKNLHIFDEPRELECYATWNWVEYSSGPVYALPIKPLTRLTRMTKVMSLKYDGGDYAISLSPEEMCRIANGEQTALVRRRVLKEMLK